MHQESWRVLKTFLQFVAFELLCWHCCICSYVNKHMQLCNSFHVWPFMVIWCRVKAFCVFLLHCCHKRLQFKECLARLSLSLSPRMMTHTPTRPAEILSCALDTEREGKTEKRGAYSFMWLEHTQTEYLLSCPRVLNTCSVCVFTHVTSHQYSLWFPVRWEL